MGRTFRARIKKYIEIYLYGIFANYRGNKIGTTKQNKGLLCNINLVSN